MKSPAVFEKMDTVTSPVLGTAKTYQLLTVLAGGQEFLLRPDCVRGIYQLSEFNPINLDNVETPDGNVPTRSLCECLKFDWRYPTKPKLDERTLVVFCQNESSFGLRVQSVSRPVEISAQQIFSLPPIAHSNRQTSILDSIALVQDRNARNSESIQFVIDPLVAIGLRDQLQPLKGASRATQNETDKTGFRDRRNDDPILRPHKQQGNIDLRGNSQLIAFSPRTPLPAEMFFRFCLPMSVISEVLLDQAVYPIPCDSTVLRGYLVWRSQPIPVIDLGIAFGATLDGPPLPPSQSKGRILVAKLPGGRHVAIQTEMQIQVLRTPLTSSVDFPAIAELPHLGAFPDSSSLLVLPDLNRILN